MQDVVPVQILKGGTGVPLICIHAVSGVSWQYQALGNYIDCPIIGIQRTLRSEEVEPQSIGDMAKNYADRIQKDYPTGPYRLIGWSFGGVVAHELAIELQRRGCAIERLLVLDAQPRVDRDVTPLHHAFGERYVLEEFLRLSRMSTAELEGPLTYALVEELMREEGMVDFSRYKQLLDLIIGNVDTSMELYRLHEPGVFDGDVVIFSADGIDSNRGSSLLQAWRPHVRGDITVHSIDCTHDEMLATESVSRYSKQLKHSLIPIP